MKASLIRVCLRHVQVICLNRTGYSAALNIAFWKCLTKRAPRLRKVTFVCIKYLTKCVLAGLNVKAHCNSALKEPFMSHWSGSPSCFKYSQIGYILILGCLSHRERLFVAAIMDFFLERNLWMCLDGSSAACHQPKPTWSYRNAELCVSQLCLIICQYNNRNPHFFFRRKPTHPFARQMRKNGIIAGTRFEQRSSAAP